MIKKTNLHTHPAPARQGAPLRGSAAHTENEAW